MAVGDVYISMGVEKNGRIPVERYEEVGDLDGVTCYRRLGPVKVSGTRISLGKMIPTATGQRMRRFERLPDVVAVGSPITPGGEVLSVALDDEHVYATTEGYTGLRRYRKSDMADAGYSSPFDCSRPPIALDDEFVYTGVNSRSVGKYRKSDLERVAEASSFPLPSTNIPLALAIDGDYIYEGGIYNNQYRLRKLLRSDLSLVYESHIPLISGSIRAMAADNGEIFVGFGEYLIKSYTELYREIG